ncbi:MAG: hypothetical protein RJQ03_02985, partial [Miltoncostaeaceae bacterium]
HRAVVRAEPLVLARGRLERHGRNVNILASHLERIAPPPDVERTPAVVATGAGTEAGDMARMRAAAPGGQHFGRGRR